MTSKYKTSLAGVVLSGLFLGACTTTAPVKPVIPADKPIVTEEPKTEVDALISKYSELYEVPEPLVRRVVARESNFYPGAHHRGHWGLMQMKPGTAKIMGFDGKAKDLLDAETNLKYGVKYLAGAYLVADGNEDKAVRYYSSGYYYDAKRKGLLEETGLKQ